MVTVLIKSDARYEVNRKRLRQAVTDTLSKQGISGDIEVSLMVVGDRKMRALNAQFRDSAETTDVLSFPFEAQQNAKTPFVVSPDRVQRLGDIVISYPQVVRQAAHDNILVDEKMARLAEHGTMHLLGFDHDELGRWFFQ